MEGPDAPPIAEMNQWSPPETRARLQQALQDAAQTGKGYDIEIATATMRGRPIWVRSIGVVEYEDGCPAWVMGTIQDITERKLAEEALRVANERLEIAAEVAQMGVWDWNLSRD